MSGQVQAEIQADVSIPKTWPSGRPCPQEMRDQLFWCYFDRWFCEGNLQQLWLRLEGDNIPPELKARMERREIAISFLKYEFEMQDMRDMIRKKELLIEFKKNEMAVTGTDNRSSYSERNGKSRITVDITGENFGPEFLPRAEKVNEPTDSQVENIMSDIFLMYKQFVRPNRVIVTPAIVARFL